MAQRIACDQRAGCRNIDVAAGIDRPNDQIRIGIGVAKVDVAHSVRVDLALGGVCHQVEVGAIAQVDVALSARGGRAVHVDIEVFVVCANGSAFSGQAGVAAGSKVALRVAIFAYIQN